jgi:hypothetical protein
MNEEPMWMDYPEARTDTHTFCELEDADFEIFAGCSCGWQGQITKNPRKSWTGHIRRLGGWISFPGSNIVRIPA